MKLSHSAVNMYSTCPEKYRLHYRVRLRETVRNSSLIFGSAVDVAINGMLLDKKNNTLKDVTYYQDQFSKNWVFADINNVKVTIKGSRYVAYAASDMDFELLPKEAHKDLGFETLDDLKVSYAAIEEIKKIKSIEGLRDDQVSIINGANWWCLRAKGSLMVEAYYTNILPKVVEVLAVQEKTSLNDGQGNEIDCHIDCVLDFGGGPVVCDNKTSTRNYESDSASTSHQLGLYKHSLHGIINTNNTAFIVLYKQIQKNRTKVCTKCNHVGTGSRAKTCDKEIAGVRCFGVWFEAITPEAKVEIIPGSISEHYEVAIVENYDSILKAIKNEIFYKNWSSCDQNYGRCQYYDVCRKGKESKNLIRL